ncbi:MAG TPA: hypothetical protein DEA22_01360 [Blastocatellia bacterium]|nr:hypothetical protein [Blastocatellia bacterium]
MFSIATTSRSTFGFPAAYRLLANIQFINNTHRSKEFMTGSKFATSGSGFFDVARHEGYVVIRHGSIGDGSGENLREFWNGLAAVCDEMNCRRILLVGPDPGIRIDTMFAFEAGVEAARNVAGRSLAICWRGFRHDEQADFFKTVAANRGARIEFFSETEAALEWLFA